MKAVVPAQSAALATSPLDDIGDVEITISWDNAAKMFGNDSYAGYRFMVECRSRRLTVINEPENMQYRIRR